MRSEGIKNTARFFAILAVILFVGKPARAQQMLPELPGINEVGSEPISFMRPHHVIFVDAGTNLPTPPSSAFAPAQIRRAYGFDQIANQGAGQIIGIVDAYDDPNAAADLAVFSKQFNLPACTTANNCFREVYENSRRPAMNSNWSLEISLDVQWAHAIAPQATILLVETSSNSLSDLIAGVDLAVRHGASVVSMSWMSGEFSGEASLDNHFLSNGVTFFAASGDNGTGTAYPAASPNVIGVGGTSMQLNAQGNYGSETAWSGSGGGISRYEHEPTYQALLGLPVDAAGARGIPDVSYNGDPSTGYAVYDSIAINGLTGWLQVGGTSAGTPQWAALMAITNSIRAAARKADLNATNAAIYSQARSSPNVAFHPITHGTNGKCGLICDAMNGYDYVTGVGTPQSNALISSLSAQK
jgi:subtilase family serine protease